MKISVKSWHYRYLEFFGVNQPHDLCRYMRKLAFWLVVGPAFFGALAAAVGFFLTGYVYAWFHLSATFEALGDSHATGFIVFAAISWIVLNIIAIAVGLGFGFALLRDWSENRHYEALCNSKPSEPNILSVWYHSVKDKICPMIEFTE